MTFDDVAQLALKLPGVSEELRWRNRSWMVGGKAFAWECPLSKADLRRFGDRPPPAGRLLALRVANVEEKELLMLEPPPAFFDIAHFSGYPAVLVRLDEVDRSLLETALVEAWYASAPPKLAAAGPPRRRRG